MHDRCMLIMKCIHCKDRMVREDLRSKVLQLSPQTLAGKRLPHSGRANEPFSHRSKLWNYCNVLRDYGMSYGDYSSAKLPSTELRASRTGPSGAFRAGSGMEERKMVLGVVFPYLLLLFSGGARRYKTSRLVFLELCQLKNNSYAGAKGKATGLLRLTRLQAD